MEKNYYIGVDGGGSKLVSVLFDQDLNLISVGRGGSINLNFASMEEVKSNMLKSIKECLPTNFQGPVEAAYVTMPGPGDVYIKLLSDFCTVNSYKRLGEGLICLLAGIQKEKGLVILSGTGSGIFNHTDLENVTHLGGWGALVGDEGSGYDIGNKGIRAAIYSYDTRGPKTILEDMVKEFFNAKDFLEVRSVLYRFPVYRAVIARLCPVVVDAADEGDEVAIKILKDAGVDLAGQLDAVIRRDCVNGNDTDAVVAGSVWKGNPYMYEAFRNRINSLYPGLNIYKPLFEPVIGSVVYCRLKLQKAIDKNMLNHMKNQYRDFLYK